VCCCDIMHWLFSIYFSKCALLRMLLSSLYISTNLLNHRETSVAHRSSETLPLRIRTTLELFGSSGSTKSFLCASLCRLAWSPRPLQCVSLCRLDSSLQIVKPHLHRAYHRWTFTVTWKESATQQK